MLIMKTDYHKLTIQALNYLAEDMDRSDSFDPKAPYDKKNTYIGRASSLFEAHFGGIDPYYLAVSFFTILRIAVERYEASSGKQFNKGMLYGNLGVSLLASGSIDEGISYLLAAQADDERVLAVGAHDILAGPLWDQFWKRDLLPFYQKSLESIPSLATDEENVRAYLTQLTQPERILLEANVWKFLNGLRWWQKMPNMHTSNSMFSALREMAYLGEAATRARHRYEQKFTNYLQQNLVAATRHQQELQDKLGANDIDDYVRNAEGIANSKAAPETKCIYLLILTRNFTSHNIVSGEARVIASKWTEGENRGNPGKEGGRDERESAGGTDEALRRGGRPASTRAGGAQVERHHSDCGGRRAMRGE